MMRTLTIAVLTLGCLTMVTGCPDPKPDKPVCGDGVCEKGKGETNYACSEDCPPVCGDGYCDQAHNEHCALDCGSDQPPPHLKDFYCGGTGPWTCESTDRYAACCANTFLTCPAAYPYACPAEGGCFTQPCASTYGYCIYYAEPCGTSGAAARSTSSGDAGMCEFDFGLESEGFSEHVTP